MQRIGVSFDISLNKLLNQKPNAGDSRRHFTEDIFCDLERDFH